MQAAPRQHDRRFDLAQAGDWAALGAEIRRRAAVMTAVDLLSEPVRSDDADRPRIIRLGREVQA